MNANIVKTSLAVQLTFMNPINEWNPHDSLLQLHTDSMRLSLYILTNITLDLNTILWLPLEDPVESNVTLKCF
jgi:hypothetical protein